MNYAFIISDGRDCNILGKMLSSLLKHNCCRVLLHMPAPVEPAAELLAGELGDSIQLVPFDHSQWHGRRMLCKIERIAKCSFIAGDRILVLDGDLLFQDNVFRKLSIPDTLYLTSRHYKYHFPINAGLWGFSYGPCVEKFLQHFVSQATQPNWHPLVAFRKKHFHEPDPDWWCDQDYLCTVFENPPPFDLRIIDLGPSYNYCPSVEEIMPETFDLARAEILAGLGNPEFKVLHFKGRLKDVLRTQVRLPAEQREVIHA